MLRLTGGAGTGEKMLKNWGLFNFKLSGIDEDVYAFDVKFGNQIGWMTIRMADGKVKEATLDCSFPRPLGAYNSSGLYDVAERMMRDSFKKE